MTFVGKQAAFGPLLVDSSVSQQRDLGKNIWNTQFLAHTHMYIYMHILYQNKMNKISNSFYLIHFFFHCLGTSTSTINYLPFSQFVYGLEELKQLYISTLSEKNGLNRIQQSSTTWIILLLFGVITYSLD